MVLRIWQAGAEDVHRDQETDGGQRVRLEIFFLICPSGRCHDPSPLRSLVCVLIDEVESLTAARKASGSEPSDAIRQVINITNAFLWSIQRVVNALLTQLDQIKMEPNVLILTTSNITGAIDGAFVDRADIVQYIGPPNQAAVYQILYSAIQVKEFLLLNSLLGMHPFSMPGVDGQEHNNL